MNRIHIGPLDLYGCQDALALLEPYMDGELPRDERRRVSFHLVICRQCAPLFRFEERLDVAVRQGLSDVEPPRDLHVKVQTALQGARASDERPASTE